MDKHRFDHAVRSLQGGAPRRQVLGVLLSGALGVAGLGGNDVAAKKKVKKVTLCLNGQPVSVKKSKKAKLLGQGATVGTCPKSPPSPPSPPAPSCPTMQKLCNGRCIDKSRCCTDADCDKCKLQTCQNETCACKPGLTPDAQGFCGPPIGCIPANATTTEPGVCCSRQATQITFVPPILFRCDPGVQFCVSPADCVDGAPCRGMMCPAVYAQVAGEGCL